MVTFESAGTADARLCHALDYHAIRRCGCHGPLLGLPQHCGPRQPLPVWLLQYPDTPFRPRVQATRAAALRRRAVADAVLLGAGMGIFTVAIWVFGGTIMGVLFPGEYYRSSTGLLTVLALSSAAGALGGPAVVALSVVERGGRKTAI